MESISVSVTIFEIFAGKIPDLDLGWFKVIQGQSSWCQLVVFHLTSIGTIIVSVTIFEIFDSQL